MKKLLSIFISILLVICTTTSAFAATEGSSSKDVKATYQSGGEASFVYSVDVTWGSMEFTYTSACEGVWDPTTHTYTGVKEASWSCDANANKVTVTNHSNTAVTATLTYTQADSYSSISGSFTKSILNLATAEGTLTTSAPTDSSLLTLNGALGSGVTLEKIGTVTVTIS